MYKAEVRTCIAADRTAFKHYWAGDRRRPFELKRQDAYCVCEALYSSFPVKMAMLLRYAVVWLTNLLPISSLKILLYRLMGMSIGKGVYISPGVFIDPLYPSLISLGDNVLLGIGCRLMTHEYTATHYRIGRVSIGSGSVIGAFSTLRCGVSIGEKVTVGMHSFVNKDFSDKQVVGGVPAKPLKEQL